MLPRLLPILLGTPVFNTAVAALLSVMGSVTGSHSFAELFPANLVWSQCIGLSVCAASLLALRPAYTGRRRMLVMVPAITLGAGGGAMVAPLFVGGASSAVIGQAMFIGVFFGGIAIAFFWLRERNEQLAAEIEARELARVEAEKRGIEAQLKMLQAQIEPHFLFNSLANVASLIGVDQALASRLLDALIRYLRASLARTRAERGSLGDEVELLRAYLEVLRIRMGPRLAYEFDIAPALLGHPLPPMLLQPLVENAITHGLEPKIVGGTLRVAARREGDSLLLTVSDDGVGLKEGAGLGGVGLNNVRARLAALFGAAARLELSAKLGAGVAAQVRLPYLGES